MTVDPDALTGRWDYAELPDNVVLGRDVWLEDASAFARFKSTRRPGLVIGDRVRSYAWTRFSLEPSGYVEIGPDCVLVGAMFMGAGEITLGAGVIVSYGVTIADCDFHPLDPVLRRRDAIAHAPYGNYDDRVPFEPQSVVIGDGVEVGIGATVLKGVTIGAGARVGPGAVVTRSVPAGSTVMGNPARVVGDGCSGRPTTPAGAEPGDEPGDDTVVDLR